MFKVKYKYDRNPKAEIVYSVRQTGDETTEFLVFEDEWWYWRDADSYEPWEKEV